MSRRLDRCLPFEHIRSRPDGAAFAEQRSLAPRRWKMELETYTSIVVVLSAALLLVAAGLGKKQLAWRRPSPVPPRRHRRY
jgi:hypothetical protein